MEHPGFTLWLTGLPGTGKTTLAGLIAAVLRARGMKVEVLDADAPHPFLGRRPDATDDRVALTRRIGYICHLLARNGVVAIVAAVSPDRATHNEVRQMAEGRLVEVYCHAAADVLAQRNAGNPAGAMAHIADAYEPPEQPDVQVDSGVERPEQSAAKVLRALQDAGYIPRPPRRPSAGHDEGDEAAIAEQMRALGYI